MHASNRIAEEAPSSSRLELLLLNLVAFPLLQYCICSFCTCCCWWWWWYCSLPPFFMASSTLETIFFLSSFFSSQRFQGEREKKKGTHSELENSRAEERRDCAWGTPIHAPPHYIAQSSTKMPLGPAQNHQAWNMDGMAWWGWGHYKSVANVWILGEWLLALSPILSKVVDPLALWKWGIVCEGDNTNHMRLTEQTNVRPKPSIYTFYCQLKAEWVNHPPRGGCYWYWSKMRPCTEISCPCLLTHGKKSQKKRCRFDESPLVHGSFKANIPNHKTQNRCFQIQGKNKNLK